MQDDNPKNYINVFMLNVICNSVVLTPHDCGELCTVFKDELGSTDAKN